MKLLRVRASNFKNCSEDFTIDFVARAKKTSEDKEYELIELADGLYVLNTAAIIGKNASGKTSALELLDLAHSILSDFRVENKHYDYDNIKLEITFFHEGNIYRYSTILKTESKRKNKAYFTDQKVLCKKYYKTRVKSIYEDVGFEEVHCPDDFPKETSKLFFILKNTTSTAIYFDCNGLGTDTYKMLFAAIDDYNVNAEVLPKIIKLFDDNISNISMVDDRHFKITRNNETKIMSDEDLLYTLSSGTTKGVLLYMLMVVALRDGFDLLIDEIENHFHKTLVENMIGLFKDKSVNKQGASLVFTTHYCEVLDLFGRQDNIWIAKSDTMVYVENMHDKYNIRPELLKSKQFYSNAFKTAVNYEDLMALKKELLQ